MKTEGPSYKKGEGFCGKIIAITSLMVTLMAIVVILNLPPTDGVSAATRVQISDEAVTTTAKSRGENFVSRETTVSPNTSEAKLEKTTAMLENAQMIVTRKQTKTKETINYKTEVLKTVGLKEGEKVVKSKGENGIKEINKNLTYKGENLVAEETSSTKTIKKVKNEIVLEGAKSSVPFFMVPTTGRYSSYYGERWGKMHKGVDIAAPLGEEIVASEAGEVIYSGDRNSYGKCIIIKHKNGYETRYAHCSELIAKNGDSVQKGDVIAKVGNTGNSTGPHVHFEVRKGGDHIDPMKYIKQ